MKKIGEEDCYHKGNGEDAKSPNRVSDILLVTSEFVEEKQDGYFDDGEDWVVENLDGKVVLFSQSIVMMLCHVSCLLRFFVVEVFRRYVILMPPCVVFDDDWSRVSCHVCRINPENLHIQEKYVSAMDIVYTNVRQNHSRHLLPRPTVAIMIHISSDHVSVVSYLKATYPT